MGCPIALLPACLSSHEPSHFAAKPRLVDGHRTQLHTRNLIVSRSLSDPFFTGHLLDYLPAPPAVLTLPLRHLHTGAVTLLTCSWLLSVEVKLPPVDIKRSVLDWLGRPLPRVDLNSSCPTGTYLASELHHMNERPEASIWSDHHPTTQIDEQVTTL